MFSIRRTSGGVVSIMLEMEVGYKAALSSFHASAQGSPNSSQAGTIINAI